MKLLFFHVDLATFKFMQVNGVLIASSDMNSAKCALRKDLFKRCSCNILTLYLSHPNIYMKEEMQRK